MVHNHKKWKDQQTKISKLGIDLGQDRWISVLKVDMLAAKVSSGPRVFHCKSQ